MKKMNKLFLIPLSLFFLGCVFVGYGIVIGEVSVGFAVFIPFIISTGLFGFFGIICIFLSMLSFFLVVSALSSNQYFQQSERDYESRTIHHSSDKKINAGGVIFIGPIPIIFGSNQKITRYMIIASIIILILIILYASLLLNE